MPRADHCVARGPSFRGARGIPTRTLPETIAAGAPLAIKSIHGALLAGLADEVERAMARELIEQRRLFATDDFREGVLATSQKRPPQFKGC